MHCNAMQWLKDALTIIICILIRLLNLTVSGTVKKYIITTIIAMQAFHNNIGS